jgi:ribonuclease BN (tRNA processing enzyme)
LGQRGWQFEQTGTREFEIGTTDYGVWMEILPLGVGGAFAKTLNQTNFLVTPAEGKPFLIDFGYTAPRVLHGLGIDLRSVAGVVVSHLHGDHVGGLEELGFTAYFVWHQRPVLYVARNLLPLLWEHSLKAGMGQRLRATKGRFFRAELATYFDVRPIEARRPFAVGSATGGSAALTCDSRVQTENLELYGTAAQLIFHDCLLTANGDDIHATLDELLTLHPDWQKKTLLVHYSDDWRDYEGRTGHMQFAREGKRYRL